MSSFGQMLRRYRRQCRDPLRGGMLTQERLGELIGHELGDAGYSGAAVSDWERGKSKIAVDDRLVLVSLVAVLHGCGGVDSPAEADDLLAAGGYRALSESETGRAFPDWRPEDFRLAEEIPEGHFSKKRRRQLVLLGKVRSFWIEGVLERSLQDGQPIDVSLRRQSESVDRPWSDVVAPAIYDGLGDTRQGRILQTFDECDRALLILGEAGAGKTTALLTLARELVERAARSPSEAIPVVLNLASWSESRAAIEDWLAEELTAKYQIPRGTGQKWLRHDELLLLLDGFDEVPPEFRDACARAINRYRRDHGLAGIVICGRSEAFHDTSTKLRLGGAVAIQPLSTDQVERYLKAAGPGTSPLRSALRDDGGLREMSQTPLMLKVMAVAYGEAIMPAAESGNGRSDGGARRRELFRAYTLAMFRRRVEHERYTPERTNRWLAWLARQMLAHNRSLFLIEEMQPEWLRSRGRQWLYLLIFGLSNGLFAGVILWLFLLLLRQTSPDLPADFSSHVAGLLGIPLAWAEFTTLLASNVLLGLLVAGIMGMIFERRRGQEAPGGSSAAPLRRQAFVIGVTVAALVTAVMVAYSRPSLALTWGILEAIVYGATARLVYGPSFGREIRTVEALGWSWPNAVRGLAIGLLLAIIAEALEFLLFGTAGTFQSAIPLLLGAFLLGGIQGRRLEATSRPNQGIRLSFRNAFIAGSVVVLIVGPAAWSVRGATYALVAALLALLIAVSLYGGGNVSKHLILRLLLHLDGSVPWRYARFLDYSAGLILLRRVGGGYIFFHRELQDYFAALSED